MSDDADRTETGAVAEHPDGPPRQADWPVVCEALAHPSYRARLLAHRRIVAECTRLGSEEPVWNVVDKLEGYRFASSLGVRVPEVYGTWDHVSLVPFDDLPDEFVLKGTTGFNSNAVWALRRLPKGGYRNVLNGRRVSPEQVVERAGELRERGIMRQERVFAEQLLDDGYGKDRAATDWKVYTFYGAVGMVMARDTQGSLNRARMRFRYWDPEWNDLGQANLDNTVDPSLEPPRHAAELLDAAARISASIPRPHVRVDFFDTPEALYFGELTIGPGGPHRLDRELDLRLGELWEAAEARLLADLVRSGALELGDPEARRAGKLAPRPARAPGRLLPWRASRR